MGNLNIGVLIPHNLQLQTQVTLMSLGWYHKSGDCAKSCSLLLVLQWELWKCEYSSVYVGAAVMCLW